MKLHTVYNESGQIMAAVQLDQPLLLDQYMSVPLPMAQEGQQVAEIDVPEEFGHLSLYDLCTQIKNPAASGRGIEADLLPNPRFGLQALELRRRAAGNMSPTRLKVDMNVNCPTLVFAEQQCES